MTYDDEKSIFNKGRYIVENNLNGAIVWDIVGDYIEDRNQPGTIAETPLATALTDALCFQQKELLAYAVPKREQIAIQSLSQQWSSLTYRSFAPRIAYQTPEISKKEKKKRKKKKRRKKKSKGDVPQRYFDGGW